MRLTCRSRLIFPTLVVIVSTLLVAPSLFAVPARNVVENVRQPDGTVIPVRQFGDERSNGLRTLDGYTILHDSSTGTWRYAEEDARRNLRHSPFIVGRDRPIGIRPNLAPAPQRIGGTETSTSQQTAQGAEPAPNLGSQPLLVLFVDFTPPVPVEGGSTAATLSNKFFGPTSSVKHYYETVSYGQFSITPAQESEGTIDDGIVSVTLGYAHPDTGSVIDDRNRNITRDALIAADAFVNFAQFDTDGDGVISATELHIIVVVAGYERSYSSSPCGASVWGHRWSLFGAVPAPILDGKVVGQTYAQFGENHCAGMAGTGHEATIGIMAHELGHDLGLPDLYDTDGSSEGIGEWSIMASGSWGQVSLPGDSPAHFDPWSKYFEGWISPFFVSGTLVNEQIMQSATNPDYYQFLPGTPTSGEYFLIENRQKVNYDASVPGSGLLIWHIDANINTFNNTDNASECYPGGPSCAINHYKVALVQADNLYNLEKNQNRGDAGDPWPGTRSKTLFDGTSSPNSNYYNGSPSGVSVSAISASGSTMTATLSVLSVTNLTADKISPQPAGTTINFTATTSGGLAPIQFKWWVFNGTSWSVIKDWSTDSTCSWTPFVGGSYRIGVWARSNGNAVDAPEGSAFAGIDFSITPPPPLSVTGLTADKVSPQPAGNAINFTATTSGGLAPIQFKWWVLFNGVWSVAKDWSTSNTFNWTPFAGGNYRIGVWARSNGNNSDAPENNAFAGVDFSITPPPPLIVTGLTADKTSPQPAGTTINFTATTTGGLAPIQFKWWVFNGTAWSVVKDWSPSNTFNWTPFGGNYKIGVWARSNGNSTDAPETNAFASIDFSITPPPPLTVTGLTADKTSPQPAGTAINFTATTTGGVAPIQFKWWVFNGTTWSVVKDWSTSDTFNWTPFGGNYKIGVWARSDGNSADAPETNAFAGIDFSIISPSPDSPLTVTGLTPDKASPQLAGTTINFTAITTGGLAPVQFKWWVLFNGVWSVANDWSASNSFSWTPTMGGNYKIGVWAKSFGNPNNAPETNAFASVDFSVTPPPPLTVTGLAADKISPQPAGTTINFTATTSGGMAPIQFKWWVFNGAIWAVVKDWSTSNIFSWTPFGGNYKIGVWARSVGNSADAPENNAFAGIDFSIIGPTITNFVADKNSPQMPGTTINFTATTSGGIAPTQFKWWLFNGTIWSVSKDWSSGNTFSWMPTVGGNYTIGVWAKSFGNPIDAPENNAFAGINFSITSPGAQVRAFNNLCLNPGCLSFTGKLTASEGYTWFATLGNYSPYQTVTSPTLSNFTAEAVGYGLVLNFPGTFNIVQGRRYAMVVTVDSSGNPVLFQVDEGAVVSSPSEELLTSSERIIGQRTDSLTARFVLSQSQSVPP